MQEVCRRGFVVRVFVAWGFVAWDLSQIFVVGVFVAWGFVAGVCRRGFCRRVFVVGVFVAWGFVFRRRQFYIAGVLL